MESVAPECTEAKFKYEACFHKWYTEKFLKGDITPECDELFKEYKACILATLKQKKLDTMLEKARRDDDDMNKS